MSKVSIKITCSKNEKVALEERAEMRGYQYMSDYLKALMTYGLLIEDILMGKPLNAHSFAGAFFDVAERTMLIGARNIKQAGLAKELMDWTNYSEDKSLVTGHVLRPANKPAS